MIRKLNLSNLKSGLVKTRYIYLLLCLTFIMGILIGGYVVKKKISYQTNSKISATQDNLAKIEALEKEINAILGNRAQFIDSKKEKLSKNQMPISSPLIDGKDFQIIRYKFKRQTIVEKRIEINDNTTFTLWEFSGIDQVIVQGYENYGLYTTSIEELEKGWKESYTNKNGIKMFYDYEYSPRSIGVVTLNIFKDSFPNYRYTKSAFLKISYALDGFNGVGDKNSSKVKAAKIELNKVLDTFSFYEPKG